MEVQDYVMLLHSSKGWVESFNVGHSVIGICGDTLSNISWRKLQTDMAVMYTNSPWG